MPGSASRDLTRPSPRVTPPDGFTSREMAAAILRSSRRSPARTPRPRCRTQAAPTDVHAKSQAVAALAIDERGGHPHHSAMANPGRNPGAQKTRHDRTLAISNRHIHASMRLRAGWIAAARLLTVDLSLAPVAPLGYGEECSSTVARHSRQFLAATSIVARHRSYHGAKDELKWSGVSSGYG